MSANGFAISGLFLGALGVVGLGQLAWDIATTYLPNEQLRILDETLEETNEIFQGAVEDGLPVTKKDSLEMRLNDILADTETLRVEVYCATSTTKQLGGLFSGLSMRLARLADKAADLRADLSTAVEIAKVKLECEGIPLPPPRDPYIPSALRRKRRYAVFEVAKPFSSFKLPPNIEDLLPRRP